MSAENPDVIYAIVGDRPAGRWVTIVLGITTTAATLNWIWLSLPSIEEYLYPVLGQQTIEEVSRTDTRLCWWRRSEKFRSAAVSNYDTLLDRISPATGRLRRSFPEIFNPETLEAISTEKLPPPGWSRRQFCIQMPVDVKPNQPIKLRQVVHFVGLVGYDLPEALPDIASDGTEPVKAGDRP